MTKVSNFFFFDWEGDGISDHVGIVEKIEGDTIRAIEGITSDSVARRSYATGGTKVMGYGLPAYN